MIATLLNVIILVLVGLMFTFKAVIKPGSQPAFFYIMAVQMSLTVIQQFMMMYVAFRDPGIIPPNPTTVILESSSRGDSLNED